MTVMIGGSPGPDDSRTTPPECRQHYISLLENATFGTPEAVVADGLYLSAAPYYLASHLGGMAQKLYGLSLESGDVAVQYQAQSRTVFEIGVRSFVFSGLSVPITRIGQLFAQREYPPHAIQWVIMPPVSLETGLGLEAGSLPREEIERLLTLGRGAVRAFARQQDFPARLPTATRMKNRFLDWI